MAFILRAPRDPRFLQRFLFFMHVRRVSSTTVGDIVFLVIASGFFCRNMSFFALVAFQAMSVTFVSLALHVCSSRLKYCDRHSFFLFPRLGFFQAIFIGLC